ncbi:MAG TPA: hypothetical protein VIP70_04345 [Nitrososphaeraceae archaeon]
MTRTYNTSPGQLERQERNNQMAQELEEKRKRLNIVKTGKDQYVQCQNCGAFIKMHKLTQPITEIERQNRIERVKRGLSELQPHSVPLIVSTIPLYQDPLDHERQICGKCFDLTYRKKKYYLK